jgi:multidrug resistance efflux pump
MAQNTETETSPAAPAESPAAAETRPAQSPPAARASDYLRERPNTRLFLIGAVIVLVVGGFFAWRYFSSYESTDDAEVMAM